MGIEIIAGLIAAAAPELASTSIAGVALSTIAAYGVVGGVVVGGTILLDELNKQHTNSQQTVKQNLPPRQRGYGRVLIGGAYYFFAANGSQLVAGFILSEGPIAGALQHRFNDSPSSDGGSGNADEQYGQANIWPWYNQVEFQFQRGTDNQTVNGLIRDTFSSWWTANHRCRGLANTAVRSTLPGDPKDNFAKFFPSGAPTYKCLADLCLVYDPRASDQDWADASTWAWSTNPALCILDYLTCGRGLAPPIPHDLIDIPSFMVIANLCEEQVPLLSGDTEDRYSLNGMYSLDEAPSDVLARMLTTCDGELYMTSAGTVGLRGGQWTEPTARITPDMVTGLQAQRGRDKLSKYNQLVVQYLSPADDFEMVEGDPWDDLASQEASQEVISQTFNGEMITSYPTALRLCKIKMAKDNPEWILSVTTNLAGLNVLGERTAYFDFPDLGINSGTFFVNSFEILDDGASCKIGLGSLSADAYEWSVAEQKSGAAGTTARPSGPFVPQSPEGLELSIDRIATGSGKVATIVANIDAPSDTSLSMVAQYRLAGASAWNDMSVDNATYTGQSSVVSDQQTYEVQVAFETYGGSEGPFISSTITIVADNVSPGAPVGLAVAKSGSNAVVSWTNPAGTNYFSSTVYQGTTSTFADATAVGTKYGNPGDAMSVSLPEQSGSYYFWVKAANRSNVGSLAGPVGITI